MASEMNRLSDRQWFEWILDAIRSIRVRKQRPTLQLICSTIRKRHVFHQNTILARVEQAKASGIICSYVSHGEISYRAAEDDLVVASSNVRSRKQLKAASNLLCIECLKTIEKGPNGNQPEPMSSCERCGISMHDFCSNQSTDGEASVPLSRLVAAGNRWFCEECGACDGCCLANESLSGARACLVECGRCMKTYHFWCMVPPVDSAHRIAGVWWCAECTPAGDREGPLAKARQQSAVVNRSGPSEAELMDGRMEVLKIKLGERVTGEDLALFRQVLMHKYRQEQGDLKRTPSAVQFGRHTLESWHSSPFPQEYAKLEVLRMCEFCLKYMKTGRELRRHQAKCCQRHPPGQEIYRDVAISVFEVDGNEQKLYCQSLCLLARLFLEDKIVFFAVESFLFYIMTKHDRQGQHVVGFFSKKKDQGEQNVSCILTLPQHQRRGYGRFLIDFSYLLSRVEQKPGTPEKPLSALGHLSYKAYWCSTVMSYLWLHRTGPLTVADISRETGLLPVDIVYALLQLGFIRYRHRTVDSRRVLMPFLCIDWRLVDHHHRRMNAATKRITVREACLRWIPNGHQFNATIRNLLTVGPDRCREDNDKASERNRNGSCSPVAAENNINTSTGPRTFSATVSGNHSTVTAAETTTEEAERPPECFTPRHLAASFSDEEMSLDSVEAFKGTPRSEVHRLSPEKPPMLSFTPIAPFRRADGAVDRLVAVAGSEQPIVSDDPAPPEPETPTTPDGSEKWKRRLNATPLSSLKRSFVGDRKRKMMRQLLPDIEIQRPKLDDDSDSELHELSANCYWTNSHGNS
ncbi:histone acetyltransferase KAT6A-like [Anopheles albimanus]|uniref:histone acetyltransferase n=1 Tax=Anopheles albimanus TaxID=7167 RepID=A0A182FSY3_ANOAL|nr:histone acetyltransferase KAT6A-like [Anopheles albimanus]